MGSRRRYLRGTEGAAALAAIEMRENGFFDSQDTVVLFNTGTGLKYLDALDCAQQRSRKDLPTSRQMLESSDRTESSLQSSVVALPANICTCC